MSKGIGHGKIILLGEHFVVYECPAIALGISNKAIVEIKKLDGTTKLDESNKLNETNNLNEPNKSNEAIKPELKYTSDTPGTIPELTTKAIRNILNAMNVKDSFHVHLSGDLATTGGLGSSAAFCVALVRALNEEYNLNLTNEQVNNYAYEGEKAFHGTPSGVDNTMATYGGAIKFTRGKGFEQIKISNELNIVVGITGLNSPTAKMVESVKKFKDKNLKIFDNLLHSAKNIAEKGQHALENGDLNAIGSLMNANQDMLSAIGVSMERNERIIKTANDAGALGAKLTGGGGGGCCIALAKDESHAQEILSRIKEAGFDGFVTKVQATTQVTT